VRTQVIRSNTADFHEHPEARPEQDLTPRWCWYPKAAPSRVQREVALTQRPEKCAVARNSIDASHSMCKSAIPIEASTEQREVFYRQIVPAGL
jgi:hypothetical protein